MKMFKLVKLDARHNWHRWYSHRLEIVVSPNKYASFWGMNCWFQDHFGHGIDADMVDKVFINGPEPGQHPQWAYWRNSNNDLYIYMRDAALTAFLLQQQQFV